MFEDYAVDLEHVISLDSTFALAYDVHPGTKAPFPNDESLPSNIVTVGGKFLKVASIVDTAVKNSPSRSCKSSQDNPMLYKLRRILWCLPRSKIVCSTPEQTGMY